VIFDSESIGDDARVLIEACFECGHSPAEIHGGRMAVMIGDILGDSASERLDRHEVGQWHEDDLQRFSRFTHYTCATN
jgi:hypothetical protein